MSTNRVLGIFAKRPNAGQAKTRLAQATSSAWALQVAEALLGDSLERFAGVAARRILVHTPANESPYFAAFGQGFELVPQCDGDLGQRLQTFFAEMRRQNVKRIVAVGTDSPTLPLEYVERAFVLLETNDIVIGPATDGGYYLIGTRDQDVDLFADIPWSTSSVLETTIARLEGAPARLALLPPWYDIDTLADWALLRGHVAAQRRAEVDPGVPRLERLIAMQPLT